MTWLASNAGLIGLLFFFTLFVIVAVKAYMPSKKQLLETHARIPLEDHHD